MSAATEDRYTEYRAPEFKRSADVAASTTLFAGCMVCYDSSGNIRDGAQAAERYFAGVANEGVDNSSGSAGDEDVVFWTTGCHRLAAAGLTADDVGRKLYLLDNQTVVLGDHASLTQHIYVGTLAEYISATECWVKIDPDNPEPNAPQQVTFAIAGLVSGALDLSGVAAAFGGADLYMHSVQSVNAYVTSGGASAGLLALTTDYTLSGGAISCVTDQSANTLIIVGTATVQR